ncbi:MAG: bifunctional aldolase/short-chain dehydrogenase [Pseudohongiellaceae bacterium]
MKNRWNTETAAKLTDVLALRVYSSKLLGAESNLVLHGGGNTSAKGEIADVFGNTRKTLFVKGSGWDLKTIEEPGFPPTDLDYLLNLGQLDSLSDSEMMKHLRLALLDPKAPTPSVEAILHALIPHTFVDHTHADAVVTLSNSPDGAAQLQSLYGNEVLILPYIMPGFVLAKQVAEATKGIDWRTIRGIVLLSHGIFTFDDDAKKSYDTMIELVTKAEAYLETKAPLAGLAIGSYTPTAADGLAVSKIRHHAGDLLGQPCLSRAEFDQNAAGFAHLDNVFELTNRGPLTPDHTIHCKAFAAQFTESPETGLESFKQGYKEYFDQYSAPHHHCLDSMPRYGVWKDKGMLYFAANSRKLGIIQDITQHTIEAIQRAEELGGWQALPKQNLFEVEYWELEQAKLKSSSSRLPFEGKVAVVTGAGSGIGHACTELLLAQGCAVLGLDVCDGFADSATESFLPLHCDVTNTAAVNAALLRGVFKFGGIDLVVSNAGSFPSSCLLESMLDEKWDQSLELNLNSHMRLLRATLPYLKLGFDPSVVIVGSKNVAAPGPGASAYSVAKAGLAQLARIAALELGAAGIRVNTVHPNAVFDTGIWDEDILTQRAAHYGVTSAEYRTNNILQKEVTSANVANVVVQLLGENFSKTTGANVPVDGGNERVI